MNVWLPERYQPVSQRRFTGADAMALRRRQDGAAAGEHVVMQSGPSQSMPVSGSAVVAVAEKTARTRPAEPEDGPPGPGTPQENLRQAAVCPQDHRYCGMSTCAAGLQPWQVASCSTGYYHAAYDCQLRRHDGRQLPACGECGCLLFE